MPIPPAEVHLKAALATLDFTPDEITRFINDLSRILDYIDQLKAVDTELIRSLVQIFEPRGKGRPDGVSQCLPVDVALREAPDHQDDLFKVPRFIE